MYRWATSALVALWLLASGVAKADEAQWQRALEAAQYEPQQIVLEAAARLQEARAQGDKRRIVNALRLKSLAKYLSAAEDEEGARLARELRDMESLCAFLYVRAERQWFLEWRREQAKAVIAEMDAIARQHRLPVRMAWLNLISGAMAAEEGRRAEAIEMYARAFALFEREGDAFGMARSLVDNATPYSSIEASPEEQGKNIEYLTRALSIADPARYRVLAGEVYWRLGQAYERGAADAVRAEDAHRRALDIAEKLRLRWLIVRARIGLGDLALAQQRWSAALPQFEAVIELNRTGAGEDATYRSITGHLGRARALRGLGKGQEAQSSLAWAEAAMPQIKFPDNQLDLHARMAEVHASFDQFQHAYSNLAEWRRVEQRIAQQARVDAMDQIKARFDVQLKEAENARLRAQRHEAQAYAAALLLALGLVVILTLYLRKRAVHARREAAQNRALAEAESHASRAKSAFVASMSHELRSPLNAMLGFSRLLLRDESLSARARQDLSVVLRCGRQLHTLINQVLDFAKIEEGRVSLQTVAFDVLGLLDEMEEMFALEAGKKSVRLIVVGDPAVPRRLQADAVKLRQVLVNLMSNAIKFTEHGEVALRLGYAAGRLQATVSDTGVGIGPQELPGLGEAFSQAQAGRLAAEGTGLGLVISRTFVRLMGGELRLTSEPGRGTTAEFDIPAPEAEVSETAEGAGRRVLRLEPGTPTQRILLVDDWPESRQLLARILGPLGFELKEAGNGLEAIELWEAWRPRLILMDMRMPEMDGREATRRIKAAERGKETKIIALTASSFEEQRQEILAVGCDDFMRKPIQEDELLEMLRRHLQIGYQYEKGSPAPASSAPVLDVARLAALPPGLRAKLQDALAELNIEAVEQAAAELREVDAQTADALAPMLRSFQYGCTAALLGKHAQDA